MGTRALIAFIAAGAKNTPLEARPDLHVLLFTLGCRSSQEYFSVLPQPCACRASASRLRWEPMRALPPAAEGSPGGIIPRFLVVSQVMLSLMLLAVAGLFLRTLRNLENQDFGFDRHNVLLVRFNAKFAGYKPEQLNALYERMMERMKALPGVSSASFSGQPALIGGNWNSPIRVRGHDQPRPMWTSGPR